MLDKTASHLGVVDLAFCGCTARLSIVFSSEFSSAGSLQNHDHGPSAWMDELKTLESVNLNLRVFFMVGENKKTVCLPVIEKSIGLENFETTFSAML